MGFWGFQCNASANNDTKGPFITPSSLTSFRHTQKGKDELVFGQWREHPPTLPTVQGYTQNFV